MRVEVPLRWADLDAQGHVNNARFLDYLQDARADFLYALHIEDLLHQGFTVLSNQIEYRAPVFYSEEPLLADITVDSVNDQAVGLVYRLYQNDTEVAFAKTTLSGYDVAVRQRRDLPVAAKAVFSPLVSPSPALQPIPWVDLDEHAKISSMKVRWADLDAYGHVNNAMIFDYVQEGRITFTAAPLRGMDDSPAPDYLWLLARQDAWYDAPIVFRKNPYIVRTGVSHIGRTSVAFCSQVDDPVNRTVCARAAAVAVFADGTGHPTPLTPEIRSGLEQFRLAGAND
ncbi:MAG: acyl-CoA thioesterase [Propionibacteriaceae bacterium]|nr:acyl-CoA thioesterase [Propionibacteriaceae bacterium]